MQNFNSLLENSLNDLTSNVPPVQDTEHAGFDMPTSCLWIFLASWLFLTLPIGLLLLSLSRIKLFPSISHTSSSQVFVPNKGNKKVPPNGFHLKHFEKLYILRTQRTLFLRRFFPTRGDDFVWPATPPARPPAVS